MYKKSFLSLSWLVCWSVSLSRKCQNCAKLPILASIFILVTFPLSFTFIHLRSLSFTLIHFHSLSIFIHSCKRSLKIFIDQKRSFTQARISAFLSQLKRVTLIHQMRKFQCHTFKRLKEMIKKKAEFMPILVPRNLRKNERMNE